MPLDLKEAITANPDAWVKVDERCSVKLSSAGGLAVSCRDTDEDPDDGHAAAALAALGIGVRLTGNGDGEGDRYVETFAVGYWSWSSTADAARSNGDRVGRKSGWPGDVAGERWMRVLIESGACAGTEAWQLTRDGELVGLYDDDGERIWIGNASWKAIRSESAPGWL